MKTRPCSSCKGTGKEIDQEAFGAEMRKLRRDKGLTQYEVAERMGLSKQHVCALEKGRRNWYDEIIVRYRKAINS